MSDKINPAHYRTGGLDVMDVMRAKMTKEQLYGFCYGNIIKYTLRHQAKNGKEDLQKAQWYLNFLIENYENLRPTD